MMERIKKLREAKRNKKERDKAIKDLYLNGCRAWQISVMLNVPESTVRYVLRKGMITT